MKKLKDTRIPIRNSQGHKFKIGDKNVDKIIHEIVICVSNMQKSIEEHRRTIEKAEKEIEKSLMDHKNKTVEIEIELAQLRQLFLNSIEE